MQQSDFERFRAVMVGMGKVYEREIDGPLLDAYWLALRTWPLKDFEAAAAHLMQVSEFMPRPAAFANLRKSASPTTGEAWSQVLEHIRGAYRDGSGIDDGPIDAAVRALGGYRALAMHNSDFMHVMERRFAEHFAAGSDVTETRAALPRIAGIGSLGGPTTGGLKRLGGAK